MTSTTSTKSKTRIVTLTDRAPVQIVEDAWPVIASATSDSRTSAQYRPSDEIDGYRITVRQHADGRTLVYAVLSAAIAEWHQPAGGESHRGGELLEPAGEGPLTADDGRVVTGAELVAAIRRVGKECRLPDSVIRACIADLPAESL